LLHLARQRCRKRALCQSRARLGNENGHGKRCEQATSVQNGSSGKVPNDPCRLPSAEVHLQREFTIAEQR